METAISLQRRAEREIDAAVRCAPMHVCVLLQPLSGGAPPISIGAGEVLPAASLIKTLVLVAALRAVQREDYTLQSMIPVPQNAVLPDTVAFSQGFPAYRLCELLTWMIVRSDNTAANVLIDLLGIDFINDTARGMGLKHTGLCRKMLDFEAAARGFDNTTTAADQCALFAALYAETVLTPALCRTARDILKGQRDGEVLLRYLWQDVSVAHKTGELDDVRHDAGVFETVQPYFLAVLITKATDLRAAEELAGRIGRMVYEVEEKQQ
ncbi:MAG: serine hydrolase [Ruthenibacterium sp.]